MAGHLQHRAEDRGQRKQTGDTRARGDVCAPEVAKRRRVAPYSILNCSRSATAFLISFSNAQAQFRVLSNINRATCSQSAVSGFDVSFSSMLLFFFSSFFLDEWKTLTSMLTK